MIGDMQLPNHNSLEISKLNAVFSDVSNSYKFYWFLSILDILQESDDKLIPINEILLRMVANVWYPLDYYKLSFGKNDGFKGIAHFITGKIKIDNNPNSLSLIDQIKSKLPSEDWDSLNKRVNALINYVPYRFVRPFFSEEISGISDPQVNSKIKQLLDQYFHKSPNRVLYKFVDKEKNKFIEINPVWRDYLNKHQGILRGFINWHLIKFLHKNNPNVIGLSEKLVKPIHRDLKNANKFWREYLRNENTHIKCIYSGQDISPANFSLDHFLPWSLVAHDLVWNIIPTPKSVNSSKSDKIPAVDPYLRNFIKLQFDAFKFHSERSSSFLLEDYSQIFGQTIDEIILKSFETFSEELSKIVLPQIQTARNMGFEYPFIYKVS